MDELAALNGKVERILQWIESQTITSERVTIELDRVSARLDRHGQELAMLAPLRDELKEIKVAVRVLEDSKLKLATQASLIATLIGLGGSLALKYWGG